MKRRKDVSVYAAAIDAGTLSFSFTGYVHVSSNPVNRIDPTGHCEETGDDGCWGWYDRVMQHCQEEGEDCRSNGWEKFGENFLKDEYYARKYGKGELEKKSGADAITYGMGASGDVPGLGVVTGFEVLNNDNGDTIFFLVIGGGASAGAGASFSAYGGPVYNLEDNMDYAGNFITVSGTYIEGLGFTVSRGVAPGDNLFNPKRTYADTFGLGLGLEASVSVAGTEYIPLFTGNEDGISLNVDNYFIDPNFDNCGTIGSAVYNAYGVAMVDVWRWLGGE